VLENNIVYGSYIPRYAANAENKHFRTFEEIAIFADMEEQAKIFRATQEEFLKDIGIPKDYIGAGNYLLKE
jgi:hypothetical protein